MLEVVEDLRRSTVSGEEVENKGLGPYLPGSTDTSTSVSSLRGGGPGGGPDFRRDLADVDLMHLHHKRLAGLGLWGYLPSTRRRRGGQSGPAPDFPDLDPNISGGRTRDDPWAHSALSSGPGPTPRSPVRRGVIPHLSRRPTSGERSTWTVEVRLRDRTETWVRLGGRLSLGVTLTGEGRRRR